MALSKDDEYAIRFRQKKIEQGRKRWEGVDPDEAREMRSRGGRTLIERHGNTPKFLEEKRRGGRTTADQLTPDERRDKSSLAGIADRDKHGIERLQQIGAKGAAKAAKGGPRKKPDHKRFQELAAKAAEIAADEEAED